MRFDKKMKHDYIKYLAQFGLQTTVDDYKYLIRKCNPNALSDSLTQSLKRFFFDIVEVSVSEDKLKVVVKDRREVKLGVITSHYADFPMLYSVSTHDAVKLLSHVWYSFEDGFDLACLTGYWDFPEKFEGSDVLRFEQPIPQITSVRLRTPIEEVFIINKGAGKRVYLEKLELPNSNWVSRLQVLPYTSESTVNTQVCVRPFIEVEVI